MDAGCSALGVLSQSQVSVSGMLRWLLLPKGITNTHTTLCARSESSWKDEQGTSHDEQKTNHTSCHTNDTCESRSSFGTASRHPRSDSCVFPRLALAGHRIMFVDVLVFTLWAWRWSFFPYSQSCRGRSRACCSCRQTMRAEAARRSRVSLSFAESDSWCRHTKRGSLCSVRG